MSPDLSADGPDLESWQNTGGHTYRCETAGIVFIRIGGDLAEDDAGAFYRAFDWLCDTRGVERVFWLIDLGRLGAISPQARTRLAKTPLRRENKGVAIFGASFRQRVIASLVDKATSLFQPNTPPLVFFDAEADARAWIEKQKRKLEASGAR